jgi:hypothetical protein
MQSAAALIEIEHPHERRGDLGSPQPWDCLIWAELWHHRDVLHTYKGTPIIRTLSDLV